jgi:hypothetical protein
MSRKLYEQRWVQSALRWGYEHKALEMTKI